MLRFPTEELDLLDLKGFLVGEKGREFIPRGGFPWDRGWLFRRAVAAFIWQVGQQSHCWFAVLIPVSWYPGSL